MSVQESGAQTLTLRILATAFGLAVGGDECIVYSSGDNGRVVNDAVDEHQWAIVLIADRARLRDAGWEGLLLRASHNLAVRTEVHEAGVEEKRPVGAARGGARGIACVMQF